MAQKKPKSVNISLISDDELRPWTVNSMAQDNLDDASKALDRIISQTSPQTRAGLRGQSSLDIVPELNNFRRSFSSTYFKENMVTFDDEPKTISKDSSVRSSPRSQNIYHQPTPPLSSGQYANTDADIEDSSTNNWARNSIEKYRQRILKKEEKETLDKIRSIRKNPMLGIKYNPSKTPKILNMSTSQYTKLKSQFE